jgi:hypothetical protein
MASDPFLRDRVNFLSGLTKYDQVEGDSTAVPPSTWTALDTQTFELSLEEHLVIRAYKITDDVGDFSFRITCNGEKIFPHPASVEVTSGVDMFLQFPVQVPKGNTIALEVFSPTGGNATLDYLSIVKIEEYDSLNG